MGEIEPVIVFEKKTEPEKEEIIAPMTDEEIREANELFERRDSKENSLGERGRARLKELDDRREIEINSIIPEFKFKNIMELECNRDESIKHYLRAEKYFKKIAALAKTPKNRYGISEGLYNLALKLEKLKNWKRPPNVIELNFPSIYQNKKKEFGRLTKDIYDAQKTGHFMRESDREKLYAKLKSGSASREEIEYELESLEKLINKERLIIMADMPDHLGEAVIYTPSLLKEATDKLNAGYRIGGIKRRDLKNRVSMRSERIEEFENLKKILQTK